MVSGADTSRCSPLMVTRMSLKCMSRPMILLNGAGPRGLLARAQDNPTPRLHKQEAMV